MNGIDFNQLGGFPLTTNVLGKLQEAYSLFNSLGAIAGEKTIISGCITTGTTVSDGVVFVNGEVFKFKSGVVSANVVIREDREDLIFGNNNAYPVVKTRYVQFGSGIGSMLWSEFKRPEQTMHTPKDLSLRLDLLEKKAAIFQAGGGMVFWNKPLSEVPAGWAEVVDWRGRMPIGWDVGKPEFKTIGKTGGAVEGKLTVEQLPKHHVKLFATDVGTAPDNTQVVTGDLQVTRGKNSGYTSLNYEMSWSGLPATLGKSSEIGNGDSFSLMNPYRVVVFIEYIG